MDRCTTILIIDDHPLFREGLKSLITRDARFELVGETGSGADGLRVAKELRPDIVLLDVSLPDKNGIELTREIIGSLEDTRVLIVSMHSKIDYITQAFQSGASGYVLKESAGERLIQGLEAVLRGELFLDNALSRTVIQRLIESPKQEARMADLGYGSLSPREQQILRMLAEGLSSKIIASNLSLSPKTVENHRASIMDKLNLHNTIDLVRYAAKLGLIDVDLWKA